MFKRILRLSKRISNGLLDNYPPPINKRLKTNNNMLKPKIYKVSKERAIQLAMNHNCVSRDIAENYTNSELKEIISHVNGGAMSFKLIADF